jgi:hypothetical protein
MAQMQVFVSLAHGKERMKVAQGEAGAPVDSGTGC